MEFNLDGIIYQLRNKSWVNKMTNMIPPDQITAKLNDLSQNQYAESDLNCNDFQELIDRAKRAKELGHYQRAEILVRKALKISKASLGAIAVLCSILRSKGKPSQAIQETNDYSNSSYIPLLTSRAAAFCDLHMWEEAKSVLSKVFAIANMEDNQQEAFNVVKRIKAAKPDLYSKTY